MEDFLEQSSRAQVAMESKCSCAPSEAELPNLVGPCTKHTKQTLNIFRYQQRYWRFPPVFANALKIKLNNSYLSAHLNSFTDADIMMWNAVLIKGAYQKPLFPQVLVAAGTYQTLNTGNAGLKKQLLSTILLVLLSSLASKLFSHFFYPCRLTYIKIKK